MKKILLLILALQIGTMLSCNAQKLPNLIPYRKGNLWGYCDSNKKIIIKPRFSVSDQKYGHCYGFPVFYDNEDYVYIDVNNKDIFIDRTGKELTDISFIEKNNIINPVINDTAWKNIYSTDTGSYNSGTVTSMDIQTIKNTQKTAGVLRYIDTIKGKQYKCFYIPASNLMQLVDEKGKVIYNSYESIISLDTVFILLKSEKLNNIYRHKYQLGDRFGNILTKDTYDFIYAHNRYVNDNNGYGYLLLSTFGSRYLIVSKGSYKGIITTTGKELIPPVKYNEVLEIDNEMPGIFRVSVNGKCGFIDYKGTEYWKN